MAGGRRKLVAVDDPLAVPALAENSPAPAAPTSPRRPAPVETAALYVRLRSAESDRLARAAFELRVHKRELVGALIARHVDGTTEEGRRALAELIEEYRVTCR